MSFLFLSLMCLRITLRLNEARLFALAQFDAIAVLLLVNPFLGKRYQNDTREMVIYRTPFYYIYRIVDTRIEVLRIWDNRQDSLA